MQDATDRFVLRNLPAAPRLVIAVFLVAVGIGYLSALVQLHFQHAPSGTLLPGPEESLAAYHGRAGVSELERLIEADESNPFNGSGSMRPAFTSKSAGWKQAVRKKSVEEIQKIREVRDGERLALIDWIHRGASKEDYDQDGYPLPPELAGKPITEEYIAKDDNGKPFNPPRVKIQSILNDRCVRCHSANKTGTPAQFPLDSYEDVALYLEPETGGGMSLTKLAQSTHAHLLSFAVLFGLTGLAFSFTSYPSWVRGLLGPFTLVAQVVDIGCWWLARGDPVFAQALQVTGMLVAGSLVVQILGTLWSMYGGAGRTVLVCLLLAAAGGAAVLHREVLVPYLEHERANPEMRDTGALTRPRHP
jgi:hypothetical protein